MDINKDELKEQIDKLYEDPCFLELLENVEPLEVDTHSLAEAYVYQESPFANVEAEE